MGIVSEVVGSMAASATEKTQTKKNDSLGKTIGEPKLSDEAKEYYASLKKKYSNMDFILVSKDKKQEAQANAGQYANASKMVVLIDEEKVERMATDENYRRQYENIIAGAQTQLPQLQKSLGTAQASVKGYGIQVNDNGTLSYFAVLEKSSQAQRDRIEKKSQEKKEAKKAEEKKKTQEAKEQQIKEKQDTVTVTASSMEDLLTKINDMVFAWKSDSVLTESELLLGQKVDFSL